MANKGPGGSGPGPSQSGFSVTCDRCQRQVQAQSDSYPGMVAHIIAIVLFVIGLPFLIFIPYCFNIGGKPVYRCPNCGNFIEPPPENQGQR